MGFKVTIAQFSEVSVCEKHQHPATNMYSQHTEHFPEAVSDTHSYIDAQFLYYIKKTNMSKVHKEEQC